MAPAVLVNLEVQKETKAKITEDTAKERTQDSQKINSLPVEFEETFKTQPTSTQGCEVPDQMLVKKTSSACAQLGSPSKKGSFAVQLLYQVVTYKILFYLIYMG